MSVTTVHLSYPTLPHLRSSHGSVLHTTVFPAFWSFSLCYTEAFFKKQKQKPKVPQKCFALYSTPFEQKRKVLTWDFRPRSHREVLAPSPTLSLHRHHMASLASERSFSAQSTFSWNIQSKFISIFLITCLGFKTASIKIFSRMLKNLCHRTDKEDYSFLLAAYILV